MALDWSICQTQISLDFWERLTLKEVKMTIFSRHKKEEKIVDVDFNIHKFTNRPRPEDPSKIMIISCFSEFGCEVVGALYCIPRIIKENPDLYVIVMGWYGRDYLYRHLADEFWETKEEVQWLRDHTLAFHHSSKNLTRIEKAVSKLGKIVTAEAMGRIAVGNKCHKCFHFWGQVEGVTECPKCRSKELTRSLFGDMKNWKKHITPMPKPCQDKMAQAASFLGPNPVGVVARNRVTYGRNLQPEFYVKLVDLLRKKGYTPIWLGEKQCTLECPVPGIVDMSRKPEARDLELTLAIVSQCKFTVQFWTASTRLAAMMGTPYLLFESPDQLFGAGQEAYRLALCTTGKRKLALNHYLNAYNNNDAAIKVVEHCIDEMEKGNWNDVIGLVDEPEVVYRMREQNLHRLGV
jgi:predicted Zn-ribbon and HTH transcriptional regulator